MANKEYVWVNIEVDVGVLGLFFSAFSNLQVRRLILAYIINFNNHAHKIDKFTNRKLQYGPWRSTTGTGNILVGRNNVRAVQLLYIKPRKLILTGPHYYSGYWLLKNLHT